LLNRDLKALPLNGRPPGVLGAATALAGFEIFWQKHGSV